MISLKNITLTYFNTQTTVLQNIDWHIKDGEHWVLFGRNGSGKTKLLEIITGYIRPTQGDVTRFGNAPLGFDIREIRKKIGYMSSFIKEMIYDNEKIIDVVLSGLYASTGMYDVPTDREHAYAYDLLSTLQMQHRANDIFSHLSDGEKQKILMLRAFINKPCLLILDEPCMGLDLAARDDFLQALEQIANAQEVSIIYVTHHIEEISSIFSKIFILNQGSCFFQGPIAAGITDHTLQTIFQKQVHVISINGKYYSILH